MAGEIGGHGENDPNNAKSHGFLVPKDGQEGRSHSGVAAVHNQDEEDATQVEIVDRTEHFHLL